jgi:glycosyltransferase involved in cell wall biosynthesis
MVTRWDGTVEVARRLWPDAIIVAQSRTGKGNALACGFAAATGDIIIMLDADGSNDAAEIPRFVGALLAGADFAKGSRFIAGGGSADITRFRRVGNWGLSTIVNTLFRTRFTDLCYGYNAFWRHALPAMALPAIGTPQPRWGDGFEIETLINIRAAAAGLKVSEVCSFERNRIYGASNLKAVRDGLRVLKTICEEFIDHRTATRAPKSRRYAPVVAASIGVGVVAATLTVEGDRAF